MSFIKQSKTPLEFITLAGSAFAALLGLMVMTGWYTNSSFLIQVFPGFVPMQYNTALGFLLAGLGLLFVILREGNTGLYLGGLLALLGGLTLSEYIIGVDLGIDQLLMEHYITTQTSHPGRMAPNTALCFMLTGVAILVFKSDFQKIKTTLIVATLGALIIGLSFIAMTGYAIGFEAAYGWGGLSRMAVHTATGFLILGVAIICNVWNKSRTDTFGLPIWLPVIAGVASLTIVLSLWQAFNSYEIVMMERYEIALEEQSMVNFFLLIVGVLFSGIFSAAVFFAQSSVTRKVELEEINQFLDERVKKRTAKLQEANDSLQQEILEREHAERALAQSEDVFFNAFNSSPEAMAISRLSDKRILYINPQFSELYGFTEEEIIGKTAGELNLWRDEADRKRLINLMKKDGQVLNHEMTLNAKSGEVLPLSVSAALINYKGEECMVAWGGDRRSFLESEKNRMQLESQLYQAQKMEAIGQLTGGIAHDFNNILQAILGYSQLAQMQLESKSYEKLGEYIRQIVQGGERGQSMIKQLMLFSRTGVKEVSSQNLADLTSEVLIMLRPSIPSSIAINYKPPAELPDVMVDPVQFDQIIMNLCLNARDAIRNHGTIDINIQQVQLDNEVCDSCHDHIKGDFVQVSVKDTGLGMNRELIGSIFNPFFSTKETGAGSGMGLAMVHGIVHSINGHLWVATLEGKGTTFHIFFPVIDKNTNISKTVEATPEKIVTVHDGSGKGKVLVVDDEPSVSGFVSELLAYHGYECIVANSAEEALEKTGSEEEINIIISDQTMPGQSGIELAGNLNSLGKEIPFILCSGNISREDETNAREAGVDAYLSKPIDAQKMLHLMDHFL